MNYGLIVIVVLIVGFFVYQKWPVKGIRSISASELPDYLTDKTRVLIDVREPHEYKGGHVQGMKNIPVGQISKRLGEIPKDKEVVLMCRSGTRSMMAARNLKKQGYDRIVNVKGGISAWGGKVVK